MKNGRYAALTVGAVLFALLFVFREDFLRGAAVGLSNCAQVIIPSLFPFMTAASFLGEGELPKTVKKFVEPITIRLFGQPAEAAIAVAVGLFGGYPSGARAASSLYKSGKISRKQAESLMLFCVNPGTGFCISREIIEKNNGWKYHLLTEDIEFSIDMAVQGEKIGYSEGSVVYDEQPETFKQSWNQRLRWSKGFYQVFGKYGGKLFKRIFQGSFACYDMLMTIFPALMFTVLSVLCCLGEFIYGITLVVNDPHIFTFMQFCMLPVLYFSSIIYMLIFIVGFITLITEWDAINCPPNKMIKYLFTFPIFMLSYAPIAITALFKKVEWTPIQHSVTKSISDFDHEEQPETTETPEE